MTEVPEDQVRGLEREGDAMEEGLERLQADIDTAHEKAEHARDRATPDAVAGDWEDESAGAQQGDDPQDAAGAEGPGVKDERGERGETGAEGTGEGREEDEVREPAEDDRDEGDGGDGHPRGATGDDDPGDAEADER